MRVTEPAILERVASIYRDLGWPAEVSGDGFTAPYSAPSAGPPGWHLYRFIFHTVVGLSTAEPKWCDALAVRSMTIPLARLPR